MNETKFTPGPWKIKHFDCGGFLNNSIQYGEDGECVAEYVANDADAALIAAAPEMYEVILRLAEMTDSRQFTGIRDSAKEAMRKVRG